MTAPPKRRWFRFSLRTMFVLVTVAACGLGYVMWQWRIVQERQAVLAEIGRHTNETACMSVELMEALSGQILNDADSYRVSFVRRLLGDQSYVVIYVPPSLDQQWIGRTEQAFPEAALQTWDLSIQTPPDGHGPFRDSLYKPLAERKPNTGTIFKTGLIEK